MTYNELIQLLRKNRHPHGLKAQAADAIEELLSRCTECREATDKGIDNINKAWHEKYEKDVAPVRHGHWNAKEDYNMDIYYECSACKETWTTIEGDPWDNGMNYCPHCGTKMDG